MSLFWETSLTHSSDANVFGICPTQDEFFLVVCEQCSQVIKPQALERHMGKSSIGNRYVKHKCMKLISVKFSPNRIAIFGGITPRRCDISFEWSPTRRVISSGYFPDFRIWYKSSFASEFSWKKRSSHQGKKEVACVVSKPLVSCLWGCEEFVNPPKLNIQEVHGALSLRPKGDPSLLPIFRICEFCQITPLPY